MMKSRNTKFRELQEMVNKFPKTLNEAIQFNEIDDEELMSTDNDEDFDEMDNEPTQPQMAQNDDMNVEEFIDDIRKKSLKGMAQLADNPDDPRYEILKRIWQTCDKAHSDQQQRNNDNRQPQRMNGKY